MFTRNSDGSINLSDPPIISQIGTDVELIDNRLIAEPWDAGGEYQLGEKFPGQRWMQWNGRYRDTLQRFVRGDPGLVGNLMTRLYGSDDLFPDDRLHAFQPPLSVNYITSHDGFTLHDLVSYREKRNWANGHDNADGTNRCVTIYFPISNESSSLAGRSSRGSLIVPRSVVIISGQPSPSRSRASMAAGWCPT